MTSQAATLRELASERAAANGALMSARMVQLEMFSA